MTQAISRRPGAAAADPRREWIGMLAHLVSPSFPVDAAQAMSVYLPFLQQIPAEAFCADSLEAAAMARRRQSVPSLDEVLGALRAWWREHRPFVPPLPAPRPEPRRIPTPAEMDAVAEIVRSFTAGRVAAGIRPLPPAETRAPRPAERTAVDDRALLGQLRLQHAAHPNPVLAGRIAALALRLGDAA